MTSFENAQNFGSNVVAGFFGDRNQAQDAIQSLRGAGFAQIGVASRDRKQARQVADRAEARTGVAATEGEGGRLEESMGEPEYADGKDFHGTLLAANIPTREASYFERKLQETKGLLVTVQTPSGRAEEAKRCMAAAGGDIGADAAAEPESLRPVAAPAEGANEGADEGANAVPGPEPALRGQAAEDLAGEPGQTILLHGELLKVHRDRVQRGEVRLRKEVVTEPRTVEVPVTHEEIVMERTPADATAAPGGSMDEGAAGKEIRIPLTEEHATVEKQPVVTEKVSIGKRVVEGVERIKEELRHEELRVENEGNLSPEELARIKRDKAA